MKFEDVEPGISFRFSPEQSRDLFESNESEIVAAALDLIEPLTGRIPAGMVQLMKWRYANGAGTVSQPYLEAVADGVNVRLCGDAFLAGEADGTEASLLSCRAALESLP
jgi:predicted NAD/FAD-dependent oxidoreductase